LKWVRGIKNELGTSDGGELSFYCWLVDVTADGAVGCWIVEDMP